MRTKHIFSTLMLAAFAAACSNEELELANNSNELAKGRFEIGQVELALGDGVDSRYAVGPNFNDLTAEAGDELGAALIDTWNETTNDYDFKYDYTISPYIHTNYSFKFNGETWASEAKMVEGNYFFYAPYNAAHVTRSSITADFNPVQQLVLNADGSIDELSTIKQLKESGEVMAVGYKFIDRNDGKTVKANLLPIYAYPVITLKNNYKVTPASGGEAVPTDLVIKQIVITNGNDGFPTKATFKFAEENSNAVNAETGVVAELRDFTYWDTAEEKNKELTGQFAKMNGAEKNYTKNLLNDDGTSSSAIVVKTPADYTLRAGAAVTFHVVMPANEYSDLKVEAYTDKGVFKLLNGEYAIAAGKRYDQNYYNADGKLKNDDEIPSGENMMLSIGGEPTGSDNIVTGAADLAAMIQDTELNELSVRPLNEDVEINAAVMTAIKAKASAFTLNVTAPATISTSLNSSTKKINFTNGAVVDANNITINDRVSFTGGTLNVKDGTVTIAANFGAGTSLEVNGGDVVLKSDVDAVVNKGKMTIAVSDISRNLDNYGGEISFVAGADENNVKTYSINGWVRNHEGEITVPAHTVVNKVSRNGESSTEAVLNVEGTVTNVITNKEGGTVNVNGKAVINENYGLIVMGSSSAVATVTDNKAMIDNTENGTVDTVDGKEGTIYYEFTEDVDGRLVVKSSKYNTIILNNMTWAPEATQTLADDVNVIMKNATIEIWDAVTITINGTLTTKNSTGKMSYVKGVAGAIISSESGGSVSGLKVTGVTLE